jgi:hypothetical protein
VFGVEYFANNEMAKMIDRGNGTNSRERVPPTALILQKPYFSLTGIRGIWKRSGFNKANPMIVGFYGDVNKIELAYYLVIVYFTALE